MTDTDVRYPIGPFRFEGEVTPAQQAAWIDEIAALPGRLRAAVTDLSPAQLDTPYRPGGWTVRQVAHHLPDSHLNAYCRCKLALTEREPVVKPYDEAAWATLPDSQQTPPEVSLALLDALHLRWVVLLRALGPAELSRAVRHPEMGMLSVVKLTALYAWHGRHHLAHITALRQRQGW